MTSNITQKSADADTLPAQLNYELLQHLIGLIYDAAIDPDFWPALLEGLNATVECANDTTPSTNADAFSQNLLFQPPNNNIRSFSEERKNRSLNTLPPSANDVLATEQLIPHLKRALQINRKFNTVEQQRNTAFAFLENIPISIIFVDQNARVILSNRHADHVISKQKSLKVDSGYLTTIHPAQRKQLLDTIRNACYSTNTQKAHVVTLNHIDEQATISLLITPHKTDSGSPIASPSSAAVLIASAADNYEISEQALSSLYQLTPREARLAKSIGDGCSVEAYSQRHNVSKNTTRTHLKSIFSKTKTNSQTELLRTILTSPATWAYKQSAETNVENTSIRPHVTRNHDEVKYLTLTDGRTLAYNEWGDPTGVPLVIFHSTLGGRFERHPDDKATAALGVRLITFDRPGYGQSDHKPGYNFLQGVDDVVELTNHLDIEKFAVVGNSIGGCYALACAYKIPNRLLGVSTINTPPPFSSLKELKNLGYAYQLFIGLAHCTPNLFAHFAKLRLKSVARHPLHFLEHFVAKNQDDLAILRIPKFRDNLINSISQSPNYYMEGFIQDMILYTNPWDFELNHINQTINIWRGETDHLPHDLAERMLANLPNTNFHYCPDVGLFFFHRWQDLLHITLAR